MKTPPANGTTPESTGGQSPHGHRELPVMSLTFAAMMVFGVLCWLAFPPVSKLTRKWLGRRHLPEFRQQLNERNWQGAAVAIQDAKHWAPNDPQVLRAGLEWVAAMGSDPRSTITLIRQLQETGAATPADLALSGIMHARLGEVSKAREIHEQLPPEARETTLGLELLANLLRADGHQEESDKVLREALLKRPDDEGSLRRLAAMDLESNVPSRRSAMSKKLWQVSAAGTPLSLTAVELLSHASDLTVPQAAELQKIVDTSTGTADRRELARLYVVSARMRLSPQLRSDLIDQELTHWQDRAPAQTKPLVEWLANEQEYARILRMVPFETASRHPSLLPSYVEALRGTGRWQELHMLVTSGGVKAVHPRQKLLLWQAEAESHLDSDPARARQTLVRIFEEAGRGTDLATTLQAGSLAEQLNQWDLAQKCYQAVADKHRQTQDAMLPKIFQLASYQHDGPAMLEACSSMVALKPDNIPFLSQKLYLQLLLGIEFETAHRQLEELSQNANLAQGDHLQLLRALAAYRQGEADLIRQPLDRIAKPDSLTAGERAVYAALLKHTGGDEARVFQIAERISPSLLLPEEKVFLQRAL